MTPPSDSLGERWSVAPARQGAVRPPDRHRHLGASDVGLTGAIGRYGVPVAVGAMVVAGAAVALLPQHAASILRLMLATIALALLTLMLRPTPGRTWRWDDEGDGTESVFEREGRYGRLRSRDVPGLSPIRNALQEKRAPRDGPPVPWAVRRRLLTVAAAAFDRQGIDLLDPAQSGRARAQVSRSTWNVLAGAMAPPQPPQPGWGNRQQSVSPAATAGLVHAVLDELERLGGAPGDPHPDQPSRGGSGGT